MKTDELIRDNEVVNAPLQESVSSSIRSQKEHPMKRSAASTTQSHKPFINRFFRESVGSLEQMNCICKWCGAPLPCIIGQSSSQISHGICSPCAESMLLEIPELPLDV